MSTPISIARLTIPITHCPADMYLRDSVGDAKEIEFCTKVLIIGSSSVDGAVIQKLLIPKVLYIPRLPSHFSFRARMSWNDHRALDPF